RRKADALALIIAAGYALDPPRIVQIPFDRLPQRRIELMPWPPADFAADLARINRVSPVVARSIGDVLDQLAAGATWMARPHFIHKIAYPLHNFEIRPFAVGADIVS